MPSGRKAAKSPVQPGGEVLKSAWARPEIIFLFFGLLGGLALLLTITPFAGGNERMNYQRAVLLAGGHVQVAPATMPGGIRRILDVTGGLLYEGRKPPYHLSEGEAERLRSIPLDPERPTVVQPNPIAVLHPVAYLPQVMAMGAGLALGLSPLKLFWFGRVAGLVAGLLLTAGRSGWHRATVTCCREWLCFHRSCSREARSTRTS